MVIRTDLRGTPATVSLTDSSITIGHGESLVVAWDRGGRLYSAVDDRRTCRRGLNGRVLIKWRSAVRRERAWATSAEADAVVDHAAGLAAALLAVIGKGNVLPADVRVGLQRAARFGSAAARADAGRFGRVYRPIGILPPDQYLSLVLQATEGCSFRSCTFCEFYRDGYRVRSASEFREHVPGVLDYLGDSLSLRSRAVFLGSANALAVPMTSLLPLFDIVAGECSWTGSRAA
jgi:hypothetical protein